MEADEEEQGCRVKYRKLIYLLVFIVILLCLTLFVTAVAGEKLHWMMIGFYTLNGNVLFFSILFVMLELKCFEKKITIPSIRKKATANISMIGTKDSPQRTMSEIPYEVGDGGSTIPGESPSDSFESSSDTDHEEGGGMTFSVTVDAIKQ